MTNLTPQQLHALAVIAKDAPKHRDKLAEREHDIDFGIQVTGKLTVSGTQTVSLTKSPGYDLILAAVLKQFGPKKRITIAQSIDAASIVNVGDDDLALARDIAKRMSSKESTKRRGAVAGTFDVAVID